MLQAGERIGIGPNSQVVSVPLLNWWWRFYGFYGNKSPLDFPTISDLQRVYKTFVDRDFMFFPVEHLNE